MSSDSPNRVSWRLAGLLGLLAFALHFDVLNRTPLLDDWWILPRVIEQGAPTPWPVTGDGSAIALAARHTGEPVPPPYMNRPLLWGAWRLVSAMSTQIPIAALHALSLLAHVVSTLLFARLLGMWVKRGSAIFATLLFALSPGGAQAISWIAAGGDALGTTFVLAAAVLVTRVNTEGRYSAWTLLGVCATAYAALLSKESSVALLPGVILVASTLPPPARRVRNLVILTELLVAVVVIAAWTRGNGYNLKGIELPTSEALLNLPYNTAQLFLQSLIPMNAEWAESGAPRGLALGLRVLGCACVATLVVLGVVGASRPRRMGIVASVGLFVVAVVPVCCVVLVQATPIHNNFFSRLVYAPWSAILAALALSFDAAVSGKTKWMATAAMILLVIGSVIALVHIRGHERRVDELISMRLDAVKSTTEETTSIVVDPHAFFQGSPLLGFGMEDAFNGKFGLPRRQVIWSPDIESLQRSERLTTVTGPMLLIDYTHGSSVSTSTIRTSSAAEPSEGWQPITDSMAIDPAGAVAPQRILGLILEGEALGPAVVTTWFAGGQVLTVAQPVRKGGGWHFVDAPQEASWPLAAVVNQVRIEGLALGSRWKWFVRDEGPGISRFLQNRSDGGSKTGEGATLLLVDQGTTSRPPRLEASRIGDATSLTVIWRFHVHRGGQSAWAMAVREVPCPIQEPEPWRRHVVIEPNLDDPIGFAGASAAMNWREAIDALTRHEADDPPLPFLQYEVRVIPRGATSWGIPSGWILGHLRLR